MKKYHRINFTLSAEDSEKIQKKMKLEGFICMSAYFRHKALREILKEDGA